MVQTITFLIALPYLILSIVPLRSTFYGKIPWGSETKQFLCSLPLIGSKFSYLIPKLSRFYLKYSPFHWWIWEVIEDLHSYTTPLRIINRYAKFGSMSTWRGELIIQGSDDKENWVSYEFKYKPGDINKKPPFIPGHLPGLDWRIWFLPSSVMRRGVHALPDWYLSLIEVYKSFYRFPIIKIVVF